MKLTRKLTAALILGILIVLAVNAALRVRREIALFERDSRRDSLLIGRMLAGSVERVWPSLGEAQALDLVEDANQRESAFRIRWVWLDGLMAELDETDRSALGKWELGPRTEPWQFLSENGENTALYTYVPVSVPDGRPGAVEVRDSMVDQRTYVRRTIYQALLTTAILVALCGGIAMGLGLVLVAKPFAILMEQARRVGRGDLSARLSLTQRDEVGELAAEMNTMCELLEEATGAAAREASERIATLEQLRHAERLSTVGQLSAGIAHELGTPLNVIMARAQLILKDDAAGGDVHKSASIVLDQAKRVTAIIRQLLDFARRRGAKKSRQRLVPLVQQTVGMLSSLAEKSSVTLVAEGDGSLCADVDPGQIQQALTNLALNAIQATKGGGTVSIRIGKDSSCPDEVFIAVEDMGSGIPAEHLDRIFEPFFTTKEAGEGTGLGLSVAYGIVKEHGGNIAVESEPGKGTRFTMRLPGGAA